MRSEAPRCQPRLVLLTVFLMALMADTRNASAAPGGAEQVAALPHRPLSAFLAAKPYEIEPGPAP